MDSIAFAPRQTNMSPFREAATRRAKIVCTIGPASNSEEMIRELMLAGMDVARLNFSHGTHEEHAPSHRGGCAKSLPNSAGRSASAGSARSEDPHRPLERSLADYA